MNCLLETTGVAIVAISGILVGRKFSAMKGRCWTLGYFIGLALICLLASTRFFNFLLFTPPFCWLTAGRCRFVVLCLAVTMGLVTPLSRLPYMFEKVTVCILLAIIVLWSSLFPFLVPALIRDDLLSTDTLFDSSGICYQSKDYTCGPAAAVTALTQLGLTANEGEIAVLAHTSPIIGTLPVSLCKALRQRYQASGLQCTYRPFDSVRQLKDSGITLAVVKDSFLIDHCVAVLDVSEDIITIADPVVGRRILTHKQFERIWRFCGIVLTRQGDEKI